jgi:hypothetical protein
MKKLLVSLVAAVLTVAIGVTALALLGVLDSESGTGGSTGRTIREVVVRADSGHVELVSGADLAYDLDATYLLGHPRLERGDAGGVFTVDARCDGALRCDLAVKVTVPPGAKLIVATGSGDLDTSGLDERARRALIRR